MFCIAFYNFNSLYFTSFPIRIIDFSFIDDWILGTIEGKCYYWIICIFLCPFVLNYRICTNAPVYFRIILFFFLCYPLALPLQFFKPIKGHVGYTFLCFYLIKKKVLYDEWSIFFNAFYFWLVISPIVIIVAGFKFKQFCFYKCHFVIVYFFFVGVCAFNFRFSGESVKLWLLFFHPCFVIIPIILNVFMYIILNRYNKLNKAEIKEKNDDNNNDITINNDNSLSTTKNKL